MLNLPSGRTSWFIRSFKNGDEAGITDLFQAVFGRTLPQNYWEWKLRSLPTTDENEWVAVSEGRIVGHYAVTPIRFKLRDRQVLIPHGCDAMTHPEYRRQGILTALGQRANAVWAGAGSPFQIGFHYGGWGSVRELLGWRPVARLVWMKRWIRPISGVARQFNLPGGRMWVRADSVVLRFLDRKQEREHADSEVGTISLERVLQADSRFDRLWNSLSPGYDILAVRDRSWVQWRCLDRPGAEQYLFLATRAHEPLGYIVLRIARSHSAMRATIVDCLVPPQDVIAADSLLHHAVAAGVEAGARSIAALVAPGSRLAERFEAAGFCAGRHGYDFSLIPYSPSMPASTAADWFLTGAEGDVL